MERNKLHQLIDSDRIRDVDTKSLISARQASALLGDEKFNTVTVGAVTVNCDRDRCKRLHDFFEKEIEIAEKASREFIDRIQKWE